MHYRISYYNPCSRTPRTKCILYIGGGAEKPGRGSHRRGERSGKREKAKETEKK